MKTARPFSSISYNSFDKLKTVLDDQFNKGNIRFFAFILHLAEKDEEKSHWHVYVEPDGQIDTNQFSNLFTEIQKGDPAPRRWRPCQNSKFDDWYLYSIHDQEYLEAKGQSRQHHYSFNQVISSDVADLKEHIGHIDYTRYTSLGSAIRAARSGESLDDYLARVPVKMVHFRSLQDIWKTYYMKAATELDRNQRKTHTPITSKKKFRSPTLAGFITPLNFKGCKHI